MQLKDLAPNKKNPRTISDKKLEALKKSLAKFGDLSGFVYNRRSKSLISGHQRQKAFQNGDVIIEKHHEPPTPAHTVAEGYVLIGNERFKYREVDADEVWANEAMLAANKHGGDWDNAILQDILKGIPQIDLELTGFDVSDIKIPEPTEESESTKDEVPEAPKVQVAKLGDIWHLGNHVLLCGDSTVLENVKLLTGQNKPKMLLWDPPWNVDFSYNEYQDDKTPEQYGDFLNKCLSNFYDVSVKDYIAVVWQSEKNWVKFRDWFPKDARMIAVMKNFVQLSGGYLQRAWDPAFMWHGEGYEIPKTQNHPYRDYFLSNTAATHDDGTGIRVKGHPCPRMVDAYEYFITGWTKSNDIVLDICLGSGTCIIASERTNRICYGIEIDPVYVDICIGRWAKHTGKDPVRSDGKKWSELIS